VEGQTGLYRSFRVLILFGDLVPILKSLF